MNFVLAVVAAAMGGALLLFLVVKMTVELRRKRRIAAERPECGERDADIERYLNRVWVLYRVWRERLPEGVSDELDERWEKLESAARALQEERRADSETAELVSRLIELEEEFEQFIESREDG